MNVYLIWQEGTSHYKIGKANDVKERKAQLQVGSSQKLKVIGVIPTPEAERKECYLHSKYKNFRFQGEWFNFPPQIVPEVFSDFSICDQDVFDTPVYKLMEEKKSLLGKVNEIADEAFDFMDKAENILLDYTDNMSVCITASELLTEYLLANPVNTDQDLEAFELYKKEVYLTAYSII